MKDNIKDNMNIIIGGVAVGAFCIGGVMLSTPVLIGGAALFVPYEAFHLARGEHQNTDTRRQNYWNKVNKIAFFYTK
jgi:hypothetical protein